MNPKTVFKTPWFTIETEEFPDIASLGGRPIYRINAPESVVVAAFTDDQKLILVKQFRAAADRYTLELPAGVVDMPRENPHDAAARELREETGYRCKELIGAGIGRVAADRIKSRVWIYFGCGAVKISGFSSEEGVEVFTYSLKELRELTYKMDFQQLPGLGALVMIKWHLNPPELKDL